MAISQILAIARYEFRLQWRRRGLLVIMLAMMVVPIGAAILYAPEIREMGTFTETAALAETQAQKSAARAVVPMSWMSIYIVMALILPIIVADTIPKDSSYRVRELFDSLPLSRGAYLAGKLLGAWLAVLAGLAASMAAVGVIWRLLLGAYDVGMHVEMLLLGVAPMVILSGGLGVLLAANQRNRWWAVAVATMFVSFCLFVLFVEMGEGTTVSLWEKLNPARAVLLEYYLYGKAELSGFMNVEKVLTVSDVYATIAFGLVELGAVWAAVWAWMRWRDGKGL